MRKPSEMLDWRAVHLHGFGVEAHTSHSSLSAEQRREAGEAFQRGGNRVIVTTSTLEPGIDVGDLDRVIEIDAPGSVASFLQRLGRTGRRPGSTRNCLFLATSSAALLHAAALISLWESGFLSFDGVYLTIADCPRGEQPAKPRR